MSERGAFEEAIELEFLALRSEEAGVLRPLPEYLQRFPDPAARAIVERLHRAEAEGEARPSDEEGLVAETLGPYRLLRLLGRGGQGAVYLADDPRLDRQVALKLLAPQVAPAALSRFRREMKVAARLDHPGLCPVLDVGEAKGHFFLVMPYLRGRTLREFASDGELSVARSLELIEAVARALQVAHDAGVVHRDIKPGNLMVEETGRVVVLDFGIARLEDADQGLTRSGEVFGTPPYLAPEQLDETVGAIDGRCDVWALGVTLYELLTGVLPFRAPTASALRRLILEARPEPPTRLRDSLPADGDAVLRGALAREPVDRYASAEAFADDLRALREGRPVAIAPPSRGRLALRWVRRHPRRALAALLFVMVALAAAASLGFLSARWDDLRRGETQRRIARHDELLEEAWLELGFLEFGSGGPESERRARSVHRFRQALDALPESPIARALLAQALIEQRKGAEALQLLGDATKAQRDGIGFRRLRAAALRLVGEAVPAEAKLDEAEADTEFALFLEAERLRRSGEGSREQREREAIALYRRAIAMAESPRPLYFFALARAARLAKDEASARETAAVLRRRWPDSPVALCFAGYALAPFDPGHALECFDAVLERRPTMAVAWHQRGVAARNAGKLEEALRDARRARKLDSSFWQPVILEATLEFDRGERERGLQLLREAVQAFPDQAILWTRLGGELADAGENHEAFEALSRSVALDPHDILAWLRGASILTKQARHAEAVQHLERAVEHNPRVRQLWLDLASAQARNRDAKGALKTQRELVKRFPAYARAWSNLAVMERFAGNPLSAERCARKALELDPRFAPASGHLADVLIAQGRTHEARKVVEDARAIHPTDTSLRLLQVELLLRIDRLEEAEAVWVELGLPILRSARGRRCRGLLEAIEARQRKEWTAWKEWKAGRSSDAEARRRGAQRVALRAGKWNEAWVLLGCGTGFRGLDSPFELREAALVALQRAAQGHERARSLQLGAEFLKRSLDGLETRWEKGRMPSSALMRELGSLLDDPRFAAVRDARLRVLLDSGAAWAAVWMQVEELRSELVAELITAR